MLIRKQGEYDIKRVPASPSIQEYFQVLTDASGTWQLATPCKFLTWKRAWLWIDKNLYERRDEEHA